MVFNNGVFIVLFVLINLLGFQKTCHSQNLENKVSYQIKAELDPISKYINGYETIEFTNNTKSEIKDLQFHLYLNAFKDEYSTFMKESNGGSLRSDKLDKNNKSNYGHIYITKLLDQKDNNLYSSIKFIQPDDFNILDKTVVSIELKKPILPGTTQSFRVGFRSKLPKVFARTGFTDSDFYLIGQWFPKLGVYQQGASTGLGKWNCHQFHANTEFFSDFGNYKVEFTLPSEYKIGATGVLIKSTKKNSRTSYYYEATNVHDFALTAQKDFVELTKNWKGVRIKLLLQPIHLHYKDRYFESAMNSLEFFEKHVGPYPYSNLTIVDPPFDASGAMGMEYPTFITCGYGYWGMPKSIKMAEVLTVHEFGHQYFQGLLASNEFEESFLDEGFNQYFEGRIFNKYYEKGSIVNTLGFRINDVSSSRFNYVSMSNPKISEIVRNAWEYPRGAYGVMSYSKTAIALQTLENMLGEKIIDQIFKEYFQKWRYKHPKFIDFVNIVNQIAPKASHFKYGKDFNWFFDQAFYKAPDSEYEVSSLINSGRKEIPSSIVKISRLGEFIMPQEVKFEFEDGKVETVFWAGADRDKSFRFAKRVKTVIIDPKNTNLLELNRINNSKTAKISTLPFWKYSLKSKFWVQIFWEVLASLA